MIVTPQILTQELERLVQQRALQLREPARQQERTQPHATLAGSGQQSSVEQTESTTGAMQAKGILRGDTDAVVDSAETDDRELAHQPTARQTSG